MQKICLVEDEKSLSELIQMNLEMEGFQVITFNNGRKALELLKDVSTFSLIILDVMLPEISGLELCKEIRKISTVPVLFLSAKGNTEDRIAGLKMGGNDYLPKPFDLEELLLKVNILATKKEEQSVQANLTIGKFTISFDTFEIKNKEEEIIHLLSKKEIELLKLFEQKEGQVVSRDEILDKIWGKDQFPTSRTIDNYILTFRKLFELDPKEPLYFHSIRGVGYKFTNPKND